MEQEGETRLKGKLAVVSIILGRLAIKRGARIVLNQKKRNKMQQKNAKRFDNNKKSTIFAPVLECVHAQKA